MSIEKSTEVCPFVSTPVISGDQTLSEYTQGGPPEGEPTPDDYRLLMFDWYQKTGFRGCLFNKVAARDARRGDFNWLTPVEYEDITPLNPEAGDRVLNNFEAIVRDGTEPGLVSYIFPSIVEPRQLGNLVKFLHASNPDRFQLFDTQDRIMEPALQSEFVGIQFRVKVGTTQNGNDALAYPMVYNPWQFTTYARRFDVPMITFNRFNAKENPETLDTYIGVDDIDLGLTPETFDHMLTRSLAVNKQAHSLLGEKDDTYHYNRQLFRAHNALVLPSDAWDN